MSIKRTLITTTALLSLFAAAEQAGAVSSGGLIYFQGELTSLSCRAAVAGDNIGTPSGTINTEGTLYDSYSSVTLPKVPVSALSTSGKTSGQTTFHIVVWGCNAVAASGENADQAGASVKAYFSAGPFADTSTGRLQNARTGEGAATNVNLELLDGSQSWQSINIGSTTQTSGGYVKSLNNGYAVLPYAVRYYATGSATPGAVESLATYTIVYQ